jgi:hypothetical protein
LDRYEEEISETEGKDTLERRWTILKETLTEKAREISGPRARRSDR